jgi:hypothetical protein
LVANVGLCGNSLITRRKSAHKNSIQGLNTSAFFTLSSQCGILLYRQTEHRNLIAQKACKTPGHPVTDAVLRPAIKETQLLLPVKTDNG